MIIYIYAGILIVYPVYMKKYTWFLFFDQNKVMVIDQFALMYLIFMAIAIYIKLWK